MPKFARTASTAYRLWLAAVVGYMLGSVLTADIASRLARRRSTAGVDLRATGTGNPGALNAMAHLGRRWGAAVLVGDMVKGAASAQAGRLIAGDSGAYAAATAAVAGHCFPVWAGFRGGKGVATSAGTTLVCFPVYVPIDVSLVFASYFVSRHAAKATAFASAVFVAAAFLWRCRRLPNAWGTKPTIGLPMYAAATSAIIAYKFLAVPRSTEKPPATP